jgi:hypothetical protein
MKIGMFGDSYIAYLKNTWIEHLNSKSQDYEIQTYGKGGSNLFYAIDKFHHAVNRINKKYDVVVFTFTWHERRFSAWPYRNDQYCAFSESRDFTTYANADGLNDPCIHDDATNAEFIATIPKFYEYMYDDRWTRFDYELEVRYILELPDRYPDTKFIFLPNTEHVQGLAKKHFSKGVLVDLAFETVSNLEPNAPAPPAPGEKINFGRDRRTGHLNQNNHRAVGELMHDIISNYQAVEDKVYQVDFNKFDMIFPTKSVSNT